ncbi:YhbD family protein [Brevibacillus sp. HD1.4A]|uniref:YhbD family protein n=1 Tax=Brevibacillus sp. HD1.4A TaxID=2738978 RepID=UPI00156ABD5B|nr:YhbD family protein [Brevibacillus sp. HD1.4A]NRQ53320.1 YhbD family protein [Brevibacillus sp. HD1.4A]
MDPNLISKKELLELTGISYGQLYRWKRKNLIPEDWFIRRATFTGQETFFPREQIMSRIAKIVHMKDDLSLDELADMFSPHLAGTKLTYDELVERNIVSANTLELYTKYQGKPEVFSFEQVLYVYVLNRLLITGEMSLDESGGLLQVLCDHYPSFEGKPCELIFVRKMGISTFVLVPGATEVHFDSGVKIVSRLNLAACIEELKAKM